MRAARAAIGRSGNGVRVHVAEPHPVVGHAVRSRHLGGGDYRKDDSVRRVGAAVVDEVVVEREHTPVAVEAYLDLVHLRPFLVDRGEMLLAAPGPLDGPPPLHRPARDPHPTPVHAPYLRPPTPPPHP